MTFVTRWRAFKAGPGPALAAFWPYAGDGEDAPEASEAEAYSALMASSQGMIATEVLSAYDFQSIAG